MTASRLSLALKGLPLRGLLLAGLLLLPVGCPDGASDRAQTEDLRRWEDQRAAHENGLVRALEVGSFERRRRAVLAAGRIQSPFYAATLARDAGREQPLELRLDAFFALGQLGLAQGVLPPPAAVDAVQNALLEQDHRILEVAVEALGKLAPPDAEEFLIPLLQHPGPAVRREAAFALFRLRFAPVWRKQVTEAPELSPQAVAALAQAVADPETEVRRAAAHYFSRYAQAEGLPALTKALEDEDEEVRVFAARGLGRAGAAAVAPTQEAAAQEEATQEVAAPAPGLEGAIEALLARLGDPSAAVRTEAALALGRLGQGDRLPAQLLEDPSFHVRTAAVQAWQGATSPESLEALQRALEDPSPTVRSATFGALARRSGAAALPVLTEGLKNDSWVLRSAAVRALGTVGPEGEALLLPALEDPDHRVQAAALDGLGALPADEARTERIAASLTSPDLGVRGTAIGLLVDREHPRRLEWIREAYRASPGVDWVEVRESVVDVAAKIPEAQPFLKEILRDDSAASVRQKARIALEQQGEILPPAGDAAPPELSPFLETTFDTDPTVLLVTSKGTLKIHVLAQEAPIHAANFVKLVQEGFYDGLIWHRVVPNFVIQGGDPQGSGWGGPGYALRDEVHRRRFRRGSVGMPKAGKDTGGCQIFIDHLATPHLDGNYTIFGEVVEGLEVIDQIEVGDRIVRAVVVG